MVNPKTGAHQIGHYGQSKNWGTTNGSLWSIQQLGHNKWVTMVNPKTGPQQIGHYGRTQNCRGKTIGHMVLVEPQIGVNKMVTIIVKPKTGANKSFTTVEPKTAGANKLAIIAWYW